MKTYQKTCAITLAIGLSLSMQPTCAGIGQRTFTGANGQHIKGKLQQYDPADQIATIRRHDGKIYAVDLKRFSEPDQHYIQKNGAELDFNTLQINPQLRRFKDNSQRCVNSGEVLSLGYVVSLANYSPSAFEQIEVEYCLFYWQGKRQKKGMVMNHGVCHGQWKHTPLEPGAQQCFETKKVLIHQEESKCTMFGETDAATGDIDGIWMRVTAVLPTGEKLTREIRSPTLTDFHEWVPTDVPVGLNDRSTQSAIDALSIQLGIKR